jgi:hypothetical protein
MQRRHPTRHDGSPIAHADRRRDVIPIVDNPTPRKSVQCWRANDAVAIATEMIRAVLVRDQKKKVWLQSHIYHPGELLV